MIESEPQPVIRHAQWPTGPVRLEWLPESSTNLPITGSHGFCFMGDNVVACNIASVARMREFAPRPDSDERRLVRFSELPSLHSGWNEVLEAARVFAASRRRQLRL